MSTYDEYEYRRGPVRRHRTYKGRQAERKPPGHRANTREVQLALKLMGGTTAKDKGEPFNDPIPF